MRDIERMLLLPVYGHRVDERDAPAAVAHRDPLDPADPFRHGEVADVDVNAIQATSPPLLTELKTD